MKYCINVKIGETLAYLSFLIVKKEKRFYEIVTGWQQRKRIMKSARKELLSKLNRISYC